MAFNSFSLHFFLDKKVPKNQGLSPRRPTNGSTVKQNKLAALKQNFVFNTVFTKWVPRLWALCLSCFFYEKDCNRQIIEAFYHKLIKSSLGGLGDCRR